MLRKSYNFRPTWYAQRLPLSLGWLVLRSLRLVLLSVVAVLARAGGSQVAAVVFLLGRCFAE